jgi:two-component system, NarL family, sensor histidine kinase DesK
MSDTLHVALAQDKKPYWVWGPLAFSLFYFLPLFFNLEYFLPTRIIFVGLIYLCFIYFYRLACLASGEKALLPVIGIISLATFGTFITPGTQALFGFAAYFLGFNFSFNKGFFGLWATLACIVTTAFFNAYVDVAFLAPAIIISVGLFFLGQAERKDRIYRAKDAKSQQQIKQLATIAERERIARDLHDLVGHSLSSIALNADLAEKLIQADKTEQAKVYIAEVAAMSRQTLSEVRHAVSGLKEVNLDSQLTKLTSELTKQGFDVNVDNNLQNITAKVESHLTLIVTELVTNILRHSNGDKVDICLKENGSVALSVFDNGKSNTAQVGNGLSGIKERCEQIGANLTIEQEQGFLVQIHFTDNV